jgi:predicted Zn-dependent protease with MMP-like domain
MLHEFTAGRITCPTKTHGEEVPLKPSTRDRFDRQLERVLAEMPPMVHELLERIPMHVEDYPADDVLEEKGIEYRDELCGLFTGRSIQQRSVEDPASLPDFITIYRLGIMAAARDEEGRISTERLQEEIRITILHELAHYHGFDEDQLEDLGYG